MPIDVIMMDPCLKGIVKDLLVRRRVAKSIYLCSRFAELLLAQSTCQAVLEQFPIATNAFLHFLTLSVLLVGNITAESTTLLVALF